MLESEDTDATNELINDGEFVQPLTLAEIEELKDSGIHATVVTCFFGVQFINLTMRCRRS